MNDIANISKITDQIYLSGLFPLYWNTNNISKLNIKFILSCTSNESVIICQNEIIDKIDGIMILTIPFNDNLQQNLWMINNGDIDIQLYIKSESDYQILDNLKEIYQNKSMIDICYHFIDLAVKSNQNILIHCMAGVSRSVSVIAYYLMKKYNYSCQGALDYIKNHRKIINPNKSFVLQLSEYHRLRENYSVDNSTAIIKLI